MSIRVYTAPFLSSIYSSVLLDLTGQTCLTFKWSLKVTHNVAREMHCFSFNFQINLQLEPGSTLKTWIAGVWGTQRHHHSPATPVMTEACSRLLQFNQFCAVYRESSTVYVYGAKIDRALPVFSEMQYWRQNWAETGCGLRTFPVHSV